MRSWLHKSGPFTFMLLTMVVIVSCRFQKLIACPSCYLFANGSDGLKNYFTSAFFVRHDPGWWFGGMNYPYGEHIVYTDNQPIWSLIMKAIHQLFPMQEHVIGMTNMLLLAALVVCCVVMYYLLRAFNLPRWYAALMSIPIALLSPQIERFNGHYSLAYTCYIPLLILLAVRWYRQPAAIKRAIPLYVAIIFMGFTHLYYLFIALVLIFMHALIRLIGQHFRPDRKMIGALGIVLAAAVTVYGIVKLTDPVHDRPQDVYGVDVYTAKAEGTFLPWYEPFNQWWEALHIGRPDVEGISYVGLALTLLTPVLLWWAVRFVRRRRRKKSGTNMCDHPAFWMLAGTGVWLFATGWIYAIGAGVLLDIFPVLGQFRSLGRLAWIFYYTVAISAVYWGYLWLRNKRFRRSVVTMALVLLALWSGEGLGHLWQSTTGVFRANLVFRHTTPFADILEKQQLSPDHFQAILQFPSLLIGPEKVTISRGGWYIAQSMQCAWETGIPIISSMMSRTSVSQAMDYIELTSIDAKEKHRLSLMDERPVLLIAAQDQLEPYERNIVDQATYLGKVNHVDLFALDVSTLSTIKPPGDQAWTRLSLKSFDDQAAHKTYRGSGAFQNGDDWSVIFEVPDTALRQGEYALQLMAYIAHDSPPLPVIREEWIDADGSVLKVIQHSHFNFVLSEADGPWLKLVVPFQASQKAIHHRFTLETSGAIIDEMELLYRE